jgi:hypothetical protein
MGYENEQHGDRGIMAGEVDYDEFDELANMDVDDLNEMGATAFATTMAPSTSTSRCPSGEEYDRIEQMCRPVQTSTGTARTRLRARLVTAAPSATTLAPIRTVATVSTHPTAPIAPAITKPAKVAKAPQAPLPSYSSPFKGGRAVALAPAKKFAPISPPKLLSIPEYSSAAPAVAKRIGLSRNAKIGLGLGAGALLLYIMTRK